MRNLSFLTALVAATSLTLSLAAIPTISATSPLYELSAAGLGLVECSNGSSFAGSIEIEATENPDGTISGSIVVTDAVEITVTTANIDGGKINNKKFNLISNDISSAESIPFCHAGDDPDRILVKGHAGEGAKIKFESICEGAGGDDIECVNGQGILEGDAEISAVV